MKQYLSNIYYLAIKELQTLWSDKVMAILLIYSFSIAIYVGATSTKNELHNAPIAFVDEDKSILSNRVIDVFYPPYFKRADIVELNEVNSLLDSGIYTFIVVIPKNFEKDIINKKVPDIQVNIDANRMTQAGIGAGYIQQIINKEIDFFFYGYDKEYKLPIELITHFKYNPNLNSTWFGSIMEIINNITMLSFMLAGAALIREREHGTLEHLLVMPLSAIEIMLAKVLSMSFVIIIGVAISLYFVVEGVFQVPIVGSIPLFLFGTLLVLFATTSMGIFIGTIARTMPQLGLIYIVIILPLLMLSGSVTPFESMPEFLQNIMLLMPTSHFVSMAQAILYRGAGIDIIWQDLVAIATIGLFFFIFSLFMFRKSLEAEIK